MKNEKKRLIFADVPHRRYVKSIYKNRLENRSVYQTAPQEFSPEAPRVLPPKLMSLMQALYDFAQKVGFSGLSELKYTLQNELEKESTIISHNSYTLLMQDYNILIEALFKLIKPDHIDILRKQLLAAKRIYIVGLDQNRNVAELATNKFTLLGMDVQAITTRDALKFRASLATQEELFIIITFSGNRHALAEVTLGEIIQNDSFIALISNYEKSICSAYADIVFLIPKTNSLKNNDTITREIFILMLFDIIFFKFLK